MIDLADLNDEFEQINLQGLVDTHIHTSPDVKPRICNDLQAANQAKDELMQAIVLKCHWESTASRAQIAEYVSEMPVFGGICLNNSVGGLNIEAVQLSSQLGGKIVWLPTISARETNLFQGDSLEEILHYIVQEDMVLATGHTSVADIFQLLDMARSIGLSRIIINHPLTSVVGASLDEQKEMAKYAYLEHCFVACMSLHDGLDPKKIAESIEVVGAKNCIMATDFGQPHNPSPVNGFKLFIKTMQELGISKNEILLMSSNNPRNLLF
jgi:hypothetical protein